MTLLAKAPLLLLLLMIINISSSTLHPAQAPTIQASTKSALKAYRNAEGKIVSEPPTAASRSISLRAHNAPQAVPKVIRNPNPNGGWMMVLDGHLRAEQHLDRKHMHQHHQHTATCLIKNALPSSTDVEQ
jgi:hypothetical protein